VLLVLLSIGSRSFNHWLGSHIRHRCRRVRRLLIAVFIDRGRQGLRRCFLVHRLRVMMGIGHWLFVVAIVDGSLVMVVVTPVIRAAVVGTVPAAII